MIKTLFYSFFCLFGLQNALAQEQIYVLHSVVGDTIDDVERNKYNIFTDSDYVTGKLIILQQNDSVYYTQLFNESDSIHTSYIDSMTLNTYRKHIDKLYQYYMQIQSNDTSTIDLRNSLQTARIDSNSLELKLFTPEMQKGMKQELKLERQRRAANQRDKNIQMGHFF